MTCCATPRLLSALALACGLNIALADERPWYLTLDGGISDTGNPAFAGGRLDTRTGLGYGGAIGRRLGTNWRVEAAVMYRNNPVRSVSSPGFDARPGDADWASVFLTVNAFYDFDDFKLGSARVRPYLGLGLGRAQEVDTDLSAGGAPREYSGSASARQFMAGLRWDYGSPWVADVGVSLTRSGRISLAPSSGGTAVDTKYRATTVMARLGYRF
jgi:opacity protein-like surface antigen